MAIPMFDKAISFDSTDIDTHILKVASLMKLDRPEDAIRAIDQAIEANPGQAGDLLAIKDSIIEVYRPTDRVAVPKSDFGIDTSIKNKYLASDHRAIGSPKVTMTEAMYKKHLEWVRAEGATDEDILWWWNLSPVEQKGIMDTDHAFRISTVIEGTKQGMKPMEALEKTLKYFVIYSSEPNDVGNMTEGDKRLMGGNNSVLPYELHGRIDKFLVRNQEIKEKMKVEISTFSSANAWARALIKSGRI